MQPEHTLTTHPGHAITLAEQAARKFDVVVAVGGDGTVLEVATGLLLAVATETALGIVPFGTGNDVARMVGVNNVQAALETLRHGQPRAIDVIEVRCHDGTKPIIRYALLFAAVGFASELIKHTTPRIKRLFGSRLCYSAGFFRALFSYRPSLMRVSCDGRSKQGRLFLACAGNSEFAGGNVMHLSPGALVDDGLLNVSLIEMAGRWETARQFFRLLRGTHIHHPNVRYFPARSLSVASDANIEVTLDGDIVGHTPATFEVKPKALNILAPSNFAHCA